MLYKDWLSEWIECYIRCSHKTRTYLRYKLLIEKHIVSCLGGFDLDELTPQILQNFIKELCDNGNSKTGKGLSPNSVNSIISVIKNSLKTANLLSYTQNNSADKIIRPKTVEKQVECFNISEQKSIETYCLHGKKKKLLGIIICLYTGLRIGELLALKWEDIDFNKSIMYINKTCHDSPNGRVIETPKTSSSYRIIPLPKLILNLIKDLKRNSKCEYLIVDTDKPVAVRSYQRTFELLLKKLRIEHRCFHALRHTFATRALECGMDVKTLSELLGHKDSTITLNRYAHSMIEHKTDMMNRLAKNLMKKSAD